MQQAAGDGDLLFHTSRELAGKDILLARQLQLLQQRLRTRIEVTDFINPGRQSQMLGNSEVVEQVRFIRQKSELSFRRYRIGCNVVTVDGNSSACGRLNSHDAPQR